MPILYDDPKDVLDLKFSLINGLILPGGGNEIFGPSELTKTAAYLL